MLRLQRKGAYGKRLSFQRRPGTPFWRNVYDVWRTGTLYKGVPHTSSLEEWHRGQACNCAEAKGLKDERTQALLETNVLNMPLVGLALVAALHQWSHLLRVTMVTAYTDHQTLTHLQQLKVSKPLRGRTGGQWLDFLAEFSGITIICLQAPRNQVADALPRLPH